METVCPVVLNILLYQYITTLGLGGVYLFMCLLLCEKWDFLLERAYGIKTMYPLHQDRDLVNRRTTLQKKNLNICWKYLL